MPIATFFRFDLSPACILLHCNYSSCGQRDGQRSLFLSSLLTQLGPICKMAACQPWLGCGPWKFNHQTFSAGSRQVNKGKWSIWSLFVLLWVLWMYFQLLDFFVMKIGMWYLWLINGICLLHNPTLTIIIGGHRGIYLFFWMKIVLTDSRINGYCNLKQFY